MIKELEKYYDRLEEIWGTSSGLDNKKKIISEIIPLESLKFNFGENLLGWDVPARWEFEDAYIENEKGDRWEVSMPLEIMQYSHSVNKKIKYAELADHIKIGDGYVPYDYDYSGKNWGFCMTEDDFSKYIVGKKFKVVINTSIEYSDFYVYHSVLRGESDEEILINSFINHPYMGNLNISGILVAMFLYRELAEKSRKYTYRFVFAPETIGAIAYLSRMGGHLKEFVKAAYCLYCLGDYEMMGFKRTSEDNVFSDVAASHFMRYHDWNPAVGGCERQYNLYGIPMTAVMRSAPYDVGNFPRYGEYHTSLDNKDIIDFGKIEESVNIMYKVCEAIEINAVYDYCGEVIPDFKKHGIDINKDNDYKQKVLWAYSLCNGKNDLLYIAYILGMSPQKTAEFLKTLPHVKRKDKEKNADSV